MKPAAGRPKEASGLLVYLMEELGDARLRCAQLKKYVKDATDLIEKSEHRDHFFEVAGNLIWGIPDVLLRLDKALDATAMAAARLDYEEIKNGLRPEKAEELESVMNDTRLRYLNRRSTEEAQADYDRAGSEPVGMVFPTQDALDKYLKAHPKADPSKHSVRMTEEGLRRELHQPQQTHDTWHSQPDTRQPHERQREQVLDYVTNSLEHVESPHEAVQELTHFGVPHAIAKDIIDTYMKERPDLTSDLEKQDRLTEALVDRAYEKAHKTAMNRSAEKLKYVAIYNGKQIEFEATSLLDAKQKAVTQFKAKKPHMVSVMLAEKDGHPVVHMPLFANQEKSMNAKSAAHYLNKIAELTDKQGRVPVAAVMTLVAYLERGSRKAAVLNGRASTAFRNLAKEVEGRKHPSRIELASVLRRIVADTLPVSIGQEQGQEQQGQPQGGQQQQQQAGAGEQFMKHNPGISEDEAKTIDKMHAEHKDELKGQQSQQQQQQ
jgi:hypothetical protein